MSDTETITGATVLVLSVGIDRMREESSKSADAEFGSWLSKPSSQRVGRGQDTPSLQTSRAVASVASSKMSSAKLAVEAKGVVVTYGRGKKGFQALQGVDLAVPEGAIYGLLGPSGCGKTSLLRCVVGRIKPAEGQLLVFGKQPNSPHSQVPGAGVGYMPQDIALYQEFTIAETLTYFGRLFRMDSEIIKQRIAFLLKFLALPEETRLIENLSGGQSRRVSLAAALIHNPPLLILDEPTVGVDPLLRESIWDHLVTLTTKEGMTVIITTHYIEEARKAHMVGLMRNGRILAESPPDSLIEAYGLSSLEDVFLKICKTDDGSNGLNGVHTVSTDHTVTALQKNPLINNGSNWTSDGETPWSESYTSAQTAIVSSDVEPLCPAKDQEFYSNSNLKESSFKSGMAKTVAMFLKNMIRLKRNLPLLLFQFVIPTIQVILFCICIGQDPFDLAVGVYNAEPANSTAALGNQFLKNLDQGDTIVQKKFDSKQGALNSVKDGDTWAALAIPENFSENVYNRFMRGMSADNETIKGSTIEVYPDMTNEQIGYVLKKVLLTAYQTFVTDLLKTFGLNPAVAQPIIETEEPIYGDSNPAFTEFMAPGLILSITYQMALGLTAMSFVVERKEGLLDRSWVAGVTATEVLVSHFVTQLLVITVQVALALVFTFLVFEIPSRGPLIWVIILTLLQGVCGMSYGLLISSFCHEERTAIMTALGTFYPNMILSGIFWPLEAMPHYIRYISICLPQTLACTALRCILSKGWSITHVQVWQAFLVTLGWTAVFLILAGMVFKAKK